MKTVLLVILSLVLVGGTGAAMAFLPDQSPDFATTQEVVINPPADGYSKAENVYLKDYVPEKVSYWEMVQRFVDQGAAAVKSKWSVGDVFIDSNNGTTVEVTLVDIAEDGTCTFLMNSVLESEMTYKVEHYYDFVLIEDPLYIENEDGSHTYKPLLVKSGLGAYYLITYETPIYGDVYLDYEYHAYGENAPDWRYVEKVSLNIEHSVHYIGENFDKSLLDFPVYSMEIDIAEERIDGDWVDVHPDYAACVSYDLRNHAVDFRLPFAQELGIGDLKGNGSDISKVWQHYRSLYSYDGNGLTQTNKFTYTAYDGLGISEEKNMDYTAFAGNFSNFWLEDTAVNWLPGRYFVNENNDLQLIPMEFPLDTPVSGSFRPCFKIVPQR